MQIKRLSLYESDETLIWLYIGDVWRQSAQIIGHVLPAPECGDLSDLECATGRVFERTCMVTNVAILDLSLRSRGYGLQLYIDLALAAAEQFDAPILSSSAWGDRISGEADRVWKSSRLADALTVRGRAAFAESRT